MILLEMLGLALVFVAGPMGACWLVVKLLPKHLWGMGVLAPAAYLVVLAAAWPAAAQDLDDPFFSAGYAAYWDCKGPPRPEGRCTAPQQEVPVPVAAVQENAPAFPGTEVDFDAAMRQMHAEREAAAKDRGGVVYRVALEIPDGTCRYVELNGRTLLVKARSLFAEDVTGLWEPGVKHIEAWNCPGGIV